MKDISKQAAQRAQRDAVVLEHLPLVKAIAVRTHDTLPVHVEVDDLVHAGVLGLIDAAEKFDVGRAVNFSSYAKHRIRGAILDSLRQLDVASRDLRRRHREAEAASHALALELHRQPAEEELAERLGTPVDRLRRLRSDVQAAGMVSAQAASSDDPDQPPVEFASRDAVQPDELANRGQLRAALGGAMQVLPPRYQQVVSLYYHEELTMKEIGQRMDINESRVSHIHKSALVRMNTALQASGIRSARVFC